MIVTSISLPLVHGVAELEPTQRGMRPHRLPVWVREQFPDPQLLSVESQPSGVRLVFDSAAERMEVVVHPTRSQYRGVSR